jgi:hypothetical protein
VTAFPLSCPAGCSDGFVLAPSCDHVGKCSCEPFETECETCSGSGFEICRQCGWPRAVGLDESGDPCCVDCLAEDMAVVASAPGVAA